MNPQPAGTQPRLKGGSTFSGRCEFMRARWQQALLHDPAYSPNLSLNSESFDLAWPARIN